MELSLGDVRRLFESLKYRIDNDRDEAFQRTISYEWDLLDRLSTQGIELELDTGERR